MSRLALRSPVLEDEVSDVSLGDLQHYDDVSQFPKPEIQWESKGASQYQPPQEIRLD